MRTNGSTPHAGRWMDEEDGGYSGYGLELVEGFIDEDDEADEDFGGEYVEAEWVLVEGYGDDTVFPLLRGAISEDLEDLEDGQLYEALAEAGFDAEQLEGFMQVLGDIGSAIGSALPAIGTGAATGASVGSVIPGLGTGIGAAVGGILGGLGSILSRVAGGSGRGRPRPASRPSPPARPQPVRPSVSRTPSRPRASAPTRPTPSGRGGAAGSAPPHGSTPSDTSAQTILRLLANPQVIQALTALALGRHGRESVEVAGRAVPVEAFAEMLGELAQEATFDETWTSAPPESYLLDEEGEALVDLASPASRSGALLGLLAAESWGHDLPGPAIISRTETLPGEEPIWDGTAESIDGSSEGSGGPGETDTDLVWIGDDADDEGEAAPAFIAVAGAIISASNLGLGVFDRLERHLLSGAFSVTSHASNYIHNPSPTGLATRTKVFRFPITAHHPRIGFDRQTFWFDMTVEYDGFNIRRVAIVEDRGNSSTLVSSDFSITFAPAAYTAPNEPIAAIVYNITGRWDPVGRGDESFSGSILVDAQGRMRRLSVSSSRRWVRVGSATARGGGPVPRPTRAVHATSVHFDRPGATRLNSADVRHLHGWYTGLPASVKTEIHAGRLPINLTGRASTTATVERNQAIARSRAQAVATSLRDLAGSSANIVIAAHGELGARTGDNTEDRSERRVDLEVTYQLYR